MHAHVLCSIHMNMKISTTETIIIYAVDHIARWSVKVIAIILIKHIDIDDYCNCTIHVHSAST